MLFNRSSKRINFVVLLAALLLLVAFEPAFGQTTGFTYQGRLTDGGTPANGNYDLQFALWDSAAGGAQIGSTQTVSNVAVSAGIFTVTLDFGANAFSGANRFLEISTRVSGGGAFTLLSPRQQITSTPYAIRSLGSTSTDTLSSACSGCVSDAKISGLAGSKITGTIPVASVPAGSTNYIQNQNTTSVQPSSNFNISGNGTAGGRLSANDVSAATVYRIGIFPVLSIPGSGNVFAGQRAGEANTSGFINSFFGNSAGLLNESGDSNSFFGQTAGRNNKTGGGNSFFGTSAGFSNTASGNSFFGTSAGVNNTAGAGNVFLGSFAGQSNTIENNNTFIGNQANGAPGITNATAIGALSQVTSSNTMVLGTNAVTVQVPGNLSANVVNATTQYNIGGNRVLSTAGTFNAFVGIGAGAANTTGGDNAFFGADAGKKNETGSSNTFVGHAAGAQNMSAVSNTFVGDAAGANNGKGDTNGTANYNTFVGSGAGVANTVGGANAFFGANAGGQNETGGANAFFGQQAGAHNKAGSGITLIGNRADVGSDSLTNATAIGADTQVMQSNTLILGQGANVGIGITAPGTSLDVVSPNTQIRFGSGAGDDGGFLISTGSSQSFLSGGAKWNGANWIAKATSASLVGNDSGVITFFTNTGLTVGVPFSPIARLAIDSEGLRFEGIGGPGNFAQLCLDNQLIVKMCSSSLRYKKDVARFAGGLDIINRLRPISFTWKQGGIRDIGLGAEEVAQVEPLLTFRNDKGEIEGVKYNQLSAVFINAIKEQQAQIKQQQEENSRLKARLDRLERSIGRLQRSARKQHTRKR